MRRSLIKYKYLIPPEAPLDPTRGRAASGNHGVGVRCIPIPAALPSRVASPRDPPRPRQSQREHRETAEKDLATLLATGSHPTDPDLNPDSPPEERIKFWLPFVL